MRRETADFLGKSRLLAIAPAYRQGDRRTRATVLHLQSSLKGATNWTAALDIYDGLHAIPLMTIHKSKGLEYHTVVFVGLDDGAWFNCARQSHEETAGFLVAFTHAKQRVIFTCCSSSQATIPKDAVMDDRAKDMPGHSGVIVGQGAGSDVAAGKVAFGENCAACHSVTAGGTGIGPSLAGVVGA